MDIQELAVDLRVLGIGQSSGVRAEGLHASDIYGDFYQDHDPKRYKRGGEPPPTLLETGLIFETMLEEGLKRRVVESESAGTVERPGEFTHEDEVEGRPFKIHYNPDLLIFNGEFRVGEIKATWMSPTDAPYDPKFDKWHTQIKFYCYMLKTRFARLYAFFVNGTWKPQPMPVLQIWDIEYSQDEIDFEYGMMIRHAVSKGMI